MAVYKTGNNIVRGSGSGARSLLNGSDLSVFNGYGCRIDALLVNINQVAANRKRGHGMGLDKDTTSPYLISKSGFMFQWLRCIK